MPQPNQTDNSRFDDQGAAFIWMWSVFCLFHIARYTNEIGISYPGHLYILATLLSLVALLKPRFILAFFLSVLIGLTATLNSLPVFSNHTFMRIFLLSGMMLAFIALILKHRGVMRISTGDFYAYFAPYGKAMLAIMYFYGVFHKLNTDFLNPETSCAVTLWETYPLPFGLTDAVWLHYISIYGALIIEAAIIIMLFIPRLKYIGLLMGLGFHFILGINGYRFFVAFSSMTFALHFLFLPADFVSRFKQGLLGSTLTSRAWVYPVLVAVILLLYGGVLTLGMMSFYYATLSLFILISLGILWAVAMYARKPARQIENGWREALMGHPAMNLLAVLFFINCAMPYIGLKTEQNQNMFSNLYTENGETNHILLDELPYLFDFQNDLVEVLRSNHPYFNDLKDEDLLIPHIQFRFLLTGMPEEHKDMIGLMYRRNDRIETIIPGIITDPEAFKPVSPWLADWFFFRYVTTKRPQICNGDRLPDGRRAIDKTRTLI